MMLNVITNEQITLVSRVTRWQDQAHMEPNKEFLLTALMDYLSLWTKLCRLGAFRNFRWNHLSKRRRSRSTWTMTTLTSAC